jgi:UDP-3-O-[3-hydroxymyristoyl] glucosamine N-acyltransferase
MESAILSFLNNYSDDLEIINKLSFKNLGFDLRNPTSGTLTFCNSLEFLLKCISIENISAIITQRKFYEQIQERPPEIITNKGFILADNPKNLFFRFHNFLASIGFYRKNLFPSIIAESAEISNLASIASNNVIIGEHSIIEDFVVIKSNVTIGKHTRIQAGSIIGNDCLQCVRDENGLYDVTHVGGVNIGNYVKVESNALICRHIFAENTILMDKTKIGGQSHVTHNCIIGERTIIAPNSFLGGGTKIGHDVFIGANSTIIPMITIGDSVMISAGSVVTTNVESKQHYTGNFAIPHEVFISNLKNSTNQNDNK